MTGEWSRRQSLYYICHKSCLGQAGRGSHGRVPSVQGARATGRGRRGGRVGRDGEGGTDVNVGRDGGDLRERRVGADGFRGGKGVR